MHCIAETFLESNALPLKRKKNVFRLFWYKYGYFKMWKNPKPKPYPLKKMCEKIPTLPIKSRGGSFLSDSNLLVNKNILTSSLGIFGKNLFLHILFYFSLFSFILQHLLGWKKKKKYSLYIYCNSANLIIYCWNLFIYHSWFLVL